MTRLVYRLVRGAMYYHTAHMRRIEVVDGPKYTFLHYSIPLLEQVAQA